MSSKVLVYSSVRSKKTQEKSIESESKGHSNHYEGIVRLGLNLAGVLNIVYSLYYKEFNLGT